MKLLNILGLIFSFLGSLSLARGLFISKKDAINIGISRACYSSDEGNLKLPSVQDRVKQKKYGIIGAILLFIGLVLQLLAQAID